jgi:hypothetical protein
VELGENYVKIIGKVVYPNFQEVGNGSYLFKAKVAVPTQDHKSRYQYIKITAWGNLAQALNDLPNDSYVSIIGHIEERSYEGTCRHCGGSDRKYWTDVIVDNFIRIEN